MLSYSPSQEQPNKSQNVKTLLKNQQRGIKYAVNAQTLLRIGNLVLYLEGKGRSKSTQTVYKKNLYYLAQRADLNKTPEVDLATARYIKKDGKSASNNYKGKLCVRC